MSYNINNHAAFAYLKAFQGIHLPAKVNYSGKDKQQYNRLISHLAKIQKVLHGEYDNKHDYLSLYTKLHELAEKIEVKDTPQDILKDDLLTFHQKFFIALYENDSKLFEDINQQIISDPQSKPTPRLSHIHEKLKAHNIKKPGFFQFTHPENWANKLFSGLLGIDYNPLKRTNVPYVAFKSDKGPTIVRMGTQVQGMQTLQPAFQNYLAAKKSTSPKKIHHVYINLLKRNIKNHSGKFERYFERTKTLALEKINGKSLGAAVITLPADNATFFEGYNKKKAKAHDEFQRFHLDDIKRQLIDSMTHNKNDFNIPDEIKAILFENGLDKEVSALFQQSVSFVLGDSKQVLVTAEQRQAIMFDFIKFGLTNFIAQKLNPDTMNISCKDAIDRGGVHALWYEFRKRMDSGTMMSEAEFNMHLDASALLVKGRPVNEHRILIWNVLNQSFLKNPNAYKHASWVKQWLVNNYPTDKQTQALTFKKNLSTKEQAVVEKHVSELAQYSAKLSQLQSVATLPESPQPVVHETKVNRSPTFGHLHKIQRDDLAPHLDTPPYPILEQNHTNIDSFHDFLKSVEHQKEPLVSRVKRKKNLTEEETRLTFEMTIKEKPFKVITEPKLDSDSLLFSTKRKVPPQDLEAFAVEFAQVILPTAKAGSTLDFSVAPIEQRAVFEKVFNEAIDKAVHEGKFTKENAPRVVTQPPPPQIVASAKQSL